MMISLHKIVNKYLYYTGTDLYENKEKNFLELKELLIKSYKSIKNKPFTALGLL